MFSIENAINGSVQSHGIKVSVDSWLDIGSQGWKETPPQVKAAAYQSAKLCGWTDEGLTAFMVKSYYPRIDVEWARVIIDTLHDLAKEYPFRVEDSV